MFRILWVYFNAFFYVLFHIIPIRKRYKHPEKYSIEERYKHVGKLCRIIVKRSGLNVKVVGREHLLDEPVLYVSNHPSMIDPYFVSYAVLRQLGAIIAGDLWFDRLPILTPWFKSFGSIYVDRKNPREGLKGINQGIENMKKGHSLILFPEGEITKIITQDVVAHYQSGGLKIAMKAQVPIISMVIVGTDKAYSAHEVIGKLRKGNVIIKIFEPYTKHLSQDISAQEIAQELENMAKAEIIALEKEI